MKSLLNLNMCLCNEAASIRKVLEAVVPFIDTCTIYIDDKSSDATEEIVREILGNMPGQILKGHWFGFKDTRNHILDHVAAQEPPAEFTLMLSADEYLRGGAELRAYLETQRGTDVHAHFVRVSLDGLSAQARVLRVNSAWRYDDFDLGIHEVPVWTGPGEGKVGACGDAIIEHVVSDPIGRMDNIWETHIPLLHEALQRNPKNARAMEFLIQSFEAFLPHPDPNDPDDTKRIARECVELYGRRFELPFEFEEQRRFFLMRFLDTARLADVMDPEELLVIADGLCKEDPDRPEPFFIRASIAATIPGKLVTEIYTLAREAAAVAERIRMQGGLSNSSPLDVSVEWKAHRLAAVAAANLAQRYPEQEQLAKEHIAAGLALGGPAAVFHGIVNSGVIEANASLEDNAGQGAAS